MEVGLSTASTIDSKLIWIIFISTSLARRTCSAEISLEKCVIYKQFADTGLSAECFSEAKLLKIHR